MILQYSIFRKQSRSSQVFEEQRKNNIMLFNDNNNNNKNNKNQKWFNILTFVNHIEHTKYVRCPFAEYGCKNKLEIKKDNDNNDNTLEKHLISSQQYYY